MNTIPYLLVAVSFTVFPSTLSAQAPSTQPATQEAEQDVDAKLEKEMLQDANRIVGEVAKLRGWEWKKPVKKGVYTEAQLRGFIEKSLAEDFGGGKLERYEWMLTSMGFLPKGTKLQQEIIDVLMNQVGGFYDPKREAFFMMTKTASFGRALNGMLIAHELTHALDDQYFELAPLMKKHGGTHDGDFAVGSVVEGSATALMFRWMAKYGADAAKAEMEKMQKTEMERSRKFFEAAPYFHTLVAKYMLGANFLMKGRGLRSVMQNNESEAVERTMKDVPLSSEQILQPEKYWDPEELDPPVVIAGQNAFLAKLSKRLEAEVSGTDVLGQIHCTLLTRRPREIRNPEATSQLMMSPRYWLSRQSRGWGGDLVVLCKRGTAKGIAWITLWDSSDDRKEFVDKYRQLHGEDLGFGVAQFGRAAVFGYGALQEDCAVVLELLKQEKLLHGKSAWTLEAQR